MYKGCSFMRHVGAHLAWQGRVTSSHPQELLKPMIEQFDSNYSTTCQQIVNTEISKLNDNNSR